MAKTRWILNESTPQDYCYKNEPRPKGKGGGVATIYNNILSISQKTGFKYNSFEVMVLHITLSREKSINDKSPVMFVLATVYRPPGHHTDFIKEFADFLSELVLAADKVLIVGDFNIHVDNEKDALGSAFIDILKHVSGPTHSRNHTRLAAIDGVGGDTGVKPQHRLRHLHRPSPSFWFFL